MNMLNKYVLYYEDNMVCAFLVLCFPINNFEGQPSIMQDIARVRNHIQGLHSYKTDYSECRIYHSINFLFVFGLISGKQVVHLQTEHEQNMFFFKQILFNMIRGDYSCYP